MSRPRVASHLCGNRVTAGQVTLSACFVIWPSAGLWITFEAEVIDALVHPARLAALAALSGVEREYVRDRTLEGHESARARGKTIGGAAVTDDAMLAVALHLRAQEMSLRDIAAPARHRHRQEKGQHPSPATVMRMLREHDGKTAAAVAVG
jgi:hypothetical protein